MFLIASTGRCGTEGLCHALDSFSDHDVGHEPDPLLREAWAKHTGLDHYRTPRLHERLEFYRSRQVGYGESIRTPNLLPDIWEYLPDTRLLVLVREPIAYARSAFAKGATRVNGPWDDTRLLPVGITPASPSADVLLGHWSVVNRYLLDFAEAHPVEARVICFQPWEHVWQELVAHLGASVDDPDAMDRQLRSRMNKTVADAPTLEGVADSLTDEMRSLWDRARRLDSFS